MDEPAEQTPLWTELRWVVPVLTAILVLPPVLLLFDQPVRVSGIPLLPLYLFVVWTAGIVLCALTARRTINPASRRRD